MAFVVSHPIDDENAAVIDGRPDFHDRGMTGHGFGVTLAKKHPPYVFGLRGASCLVHKVRRVELGWWRVSRDGHKLVKLKRPVMTAYTHCGYYFRLDSDVARTCHMPNPNALPCGRCLGEGAVFPKRANGRSKHSGLTRAEAHVKLGCIMNGY